MNTIECPRCLGKKHVDEADIKRLNRENDWLPGACAYCDERGIVDSNKPENVPVDKIDLAHQIGIKELILALYEKTIKLIIEGKNDSEILEELEKKGLTREIGEKIIDKAKTEINKVRNKAHREVAGEYFLKGLGFLALGAVITGITYSIASGGGTYVVTTGLFVVGGLYVIIGFFKFLSNL
jgi:hypothetical protein